MRGDSVRFHRRLGFHVLAFAAVIAAGHPMNRSAAGQAEKSRREPARPADVATIDAIVAALYDSISGPAGPRDWERLRSLFLPGARLIPCRRPPGTTATEAEVLSVDEFIRLAGEHIQRQGFYEREIHRRLERFGAVAHVFSTYESRHAQDDARPFSRGINSIQLFFDDTRWWVVTIFWDSERPDQPISPECLPRR